MPDQDDYRIMRAVWRAAHYFENRIVALFGSNGWRDFDIEKLKTKESCFGTEFTSDVLDSPVHVGFQEGQTIDIRMVTLREGLLLDQSHVIVRDTRNTGALIPIVKARQWVLESNQSEPVGYTGGWPNSRRTALRIPTGTPFEWTLFVWRDGDRLIGEYLVEEAPAPARGEVVRAFVPPQHDGVWEFTFVEPVGPDDVST